MVTLPSKIEETRSRLYSVAAWVDIIINCSTWALNLMACVFFCSLQVCCHSTPLWHLYKSTTLWKKYIPVPGHLWSSHHLSPMSCTCSTELQGPSTNADAFLVPGGTFHFGQHICALSREETGLWGREGSFPHPSGTVTGHTCLKLGLKRGSEQH